ncbi:MAG TPA: 50S ribosomal protein L13 [Candidatus Woesebacteria bacterium]|nr:50S ribosomal protein L13 [Candidatus Woesebacteria bacterium]
MFQKFKTFIQKKEEVQRDWLLYDATGQVLGRLATEIAGKLIGKDKVTYTPNVDSGDYVVLLNAEKIEVTRNKATKKIYSWNTGFPGGLRQRSFDEMMAKNPEKLIKHAVKNMLPKNRLRAERLNRLKIIVGNDNPYQGMIKAK